MVMLASGLHIKLFNSNVLTKNSYNKLDFNANLFHGWGFLVFCFLMKKVNRIVEVMLADD